MKYSLGDLIALDRYPIDSPASDMYRQRVSDAHTGDLGRQDLLGVIALSA